VRADLARGGVGVNTGADGRYTRSVSGSRWALSNEA
jgi:hypothetical protein